MTAAFHYIPNYQTSFHVQQLFEQRYGCEVVITIQVMIMTSNTLAKLCDDIICQPLGLHGALPSSDIQPEGIQWVKMKQTKISLYR